MDRLNELIVKNELSNYRLAKLLKVGEGTIRHWRKGVIPRREKLQRLADFFHVHPAWLLYGEKQYKPTLHSQAQFLAEEIANYGPEAILKCRQLLKIFFSGETQRDIAVQETKQKGRRKAVKVV